MARLLALGLALVGARASPTCDARLARAAHQISELRALVAAADPHSLSLANRTLVGLDDIVRTLRANDGAARTTRAARVEHPSLALEADDDGGVVSDYQSLVASIALGGTTTVMQDIVFAGTIQVPTGTNATIVGATGAEILDGGGEHRHFCVQEGGTLHLKHLTLKNGNAIGGSGGAVYIWGRGTFTGCTMISNTASGAQGGAVSIDSTGSGTFTDCRFDSNTAHDVSQCTPPTHIRPLLVR